MLEGYAPQATGFMACLQQVLRGIKIAQSILFHPRQRIPITPGLLREIKIAWEKKDLSQDKRML